MPIRFWSPPDACSLPASTNQSSRGNKPSGSRKGRPRPGIRSFENENPLLCVLEGTQFLGLAKKKKATTVPNIGAFLRAPIFGCKEHQRAKQIFACLPPCPMLTHTVPIRYHGLSKPSPLVPFVTRETLKTRHLYEAGRRLF